MAAVPTAVSIEEYLHAFYEWEPEYEDGQVVERPLPDELHSLVMLAIIRAVCASGTGLFALPELRIRIGESRFRIPDLSFYADEPPKLGNTKPPLAVVEVVSPDDRYPVLLDRLADLSAFGIGHLWLISPEQRILQRYEHGSLVKVDSLEIPERGLSIPAELIFADLY